MGDTYSQSTDPSDDEEQEGAAGPSMKQDMLTDRHARQTEQASHGRCPPSPSPQHTQHHASLHQEPSVTLDTQYDPAEDAEMQEGELEDQLPFVQWIVPSWLQQCFVWR